MTAERSLENDFDALLDRGAEARQMGAGGGRARPLAPCEEALRRAPDGLAGALAEVRDDLGIATHAREALLSLEEFLDPSGARRGAYTLEDVRDPARGGHDDPGGSFREPVREEAGHGPIRSRRPEDRAADLDDRGLGAGAQATTSRRCRRARSRACATSASRSPGSST